MCLLKIIYWEKMMNLEQLKIKWAEKYASVPEQLKKVQQIPAVATAFNTNIDAVIKVSGVQLKKLIEQYNISIAELEDIKLNGFRTPKDAIIGVAKCFSRGIAEEWTTADIAVYRWLEQNIGYDRLQMGGQGGIIANAMALLGIKKVVTHTNSHPSLQAKQFLDLDNLLAFDEDGSLKKAISISRNDAPMIHWIIEFDKGDSFETAGKTFMCPKSNRFIATYDPLNMNLTINPHFTDYLNKNNVDYLLLSGFHPLLSENNGLELINQAVPLIKKWKEVNPKLIIHLEIASTQDEKIRLAIIEKIAPLVDSAGLNERETLDLLNVTGQQSLAQRIEQNLHADTLFEAIMFLKKHLRVPRIQLHMFGLYMTLQDETFPYSASQNLSGMMTAAVVASSKAYVGALTKYTDITQTLNCLASEQGLNELSRLAEYVQKAELVEEGICTVGEYTLSAIPTILVDKPKTLVGMGDTISSISLIAGR